MTTKNTFKIDGKKFNVKMKISALLLLFIPFKFSAQISGLVIDKSTNTPIVGAKIIATDGSKIISDFNGEFKLNC